MTFSIEQLGEIDNIVDKWCVARVPPELKSQIDHDYDRQVGTLCACAHCQAPHGCLGLGISNHSVHTTRNGGSNLSKFDRFGAYFLYDLLGRAAHQTHAHAIKFTFDIGVGQCRFNRCI